MADAEFEAVEQLLCGAIPERKSEVLSLLKTHGIGFQRASDTSGFKLENFYGQVVYNDRTLRQLYLLSFLAWRALQAYSGLILLMGVRGIAFETEAVGGLSGQAQADADVDRLASTLATIRDAWGIDDVAWPSDIPTPTLAKHTEVEHQAAQEVALLAAAYMILHEVNHIALAAAGSASGGWAEEMECDDFARAFLLDQVEAYANSAKVPFEKVLNKRAIGIALANGVYAEITPTALWSGSTHPPIIERFKANFRSWPSDRNASPWVYMACICLARLRREGRLSGKIEFKSARELCEKLTEKLT